MNIDGSSLAAVKHKYVSPSTELLFIATEQSILIFSNEHTGEEELFTMPYHEI